MPQERIHEVSWSGSEEQRHEQGVCLPPTRETNKTPRYFVAAGTSCSITRITPLNWKAYRTTKDLGFERYETSGGCSVTFREQGYLLKVQWCLVKRRNS